MSITGATYSGQDGGSKQQNDELLVLVQDCRAGVRMAQKRLYDIYSPKAFAVIKRYVYDDAEAAEELLNDSFYKVLTKLDQYSFQGSFEGWIRRIVINTVTDYLRKTLDKEVPREVQPDDARVGADGVARIAHKELLAMVHELPNGQRTVFNLFVIENYSHREIRVLLGITENNSRWYLNDARRRLKEKIKFHQ